MEPIRIKARKGLLIALAVTLAGAALYLAFGNTDISRDYKNIDLTDRLSDTELRLPPPGNGAERIFLFGFDRRTNPVEDARQYIPFLKYLEKKTGYKFMLKFAEESALADEAGRGDVHFAIAGAGSYLVAREKYGVIPLVRGLNEENKAEYRSVIVVASGSNINKIDELRDRRFAFGNIHSTQGHVIPRIALEDHGISLKDLARYEFTGSHLNAANAVSSGRADAAGLQDVLGMRLAKEGFVRIIYTSRYYPSSGIFANKNVPSDVLKNIMKALVDFQPKGRDAAGLYRWDRTEMPNGFVAALDEDYAEMRKYMIKFGIIPKSKKAAP
ncbi:MAG: phosphate/phosphite/phosphonate ABC transporter substrate-binding protein [Nitrospirae bacterium]|nr:phosphate/phosphite/phosphonate ABC transporter substrate-binding protein [Nitrospirota bacterium]MCL5978385.1 phosphate/phosphite/phosphonate ABC transporter substrate-binding protein [Nitrospirota bacterium]